MAGALLLVEIFVTVLIFLLGKVDGLIPPTGLYFILNNNVYLPGASVNLSDIGSESEGRGAGSTLRCITTNVNVGCCRPNDNNTNPVLFGGRVGDWLYPNNTVVPRPPDSSDFSRRVFYQEVRLTVESDKTAGPPGTYTCTVPNGTTGEVVLASIMLAGPPSIPANVAHSSVQSTQVTLTWTSLPSDSVNTYTISYINTGSECTLDSRATQMTTMTSITITGLEESTQYQFSITATNNFGMSSAAVYSTSTLPSTPTGSPLLALQSRTATSFTVTWSRETCLSRNGPDLHYTVRYFMTGTTQILETQNVAINSLTYTANSLTPATSYTIQVEYVNIVGSGPTTSLTISTFGLPFHGYQNRVAYPNNSIVTLTDIGIDVNALVCYTDLSTCCRNEDNPSGGGLGFWAFPDGSLTIGRGAANMNMFSRNRTKQAILLHRGSNASGPSGIFTCYVPDVNMRQRRVYFGIYPIGEGLLNIQSTSYDSSTGIVNCISVGGPVTDLTWNRNGQSYLQSKIIADTVIATYHNLLYISSNRLSDYTGIFNCTVSNSRGSASRTTEEIKSIGLFGNRNTYDTGSTASVICFTNLSVVSVQWLNSSADVSFSTERIKNNELQLIIEDTISQDTHGTSFTCEVKYLLPTEENTETIVFTIRTTEELSDPVSSFFISPTSDSIVRISWMPPGSPNGIITAYYLKLVDLKIDNVLISTNIDISETTYTQTGLVAGVPYEVNVSAINSIGLGKNTSQIFFTKELQPLESPILTVTRTSASTALLWTSLTLIQARGFVTNYTILYYQVLDSKKRQQPSAMSITIASSITRATIDGLDENSVYSIQIAANNGAGSGPLSMAMLAQLDQDTSMQPSRAVNMNVVSVVISVLVCFIIITAIISTTVIVVYKMKISRQHPSNSAKQDPSTTGREYEEVDNINHEVSLKNIGINPEEMMMSSCVAYGELNASIKNTKNQEEMHNVYETVQ